MNHTFKYTDADVDLLKKVLSLYPTRHVFEAMAEWNALTGHNVSPNHAKEILRKRFGTPPTVYMVQETTRAQREKLLADGELRTKNAVGKGYAKVTKPLPKAADVYAGSPVDDVEQIATTVARAVVQALRPQHVEARDPRQPTIGIKEEEPSDDGDEDPSDSPEQIEKLLKIVGATKKGHYVSLEAICDKLGVHPAKARALVDEAKAKGFRVELDGSFVGQAPPPDPSVETTIRMPAPVANKHMIALIGDPHIGSKHHMKGEFLDFVGTAYERGVRTFPCVGDLMDGVYSFSLYEQVQRGFEEQCQAAIEEIPRLEGAYWPWILGNHDETFESKSGMSVISAANAMFRDAGRTDVECVGSRGKILRLKAPGEKRGVSLELWHPKKGAGYALTYTMQNHIRDYPVGRKPDILAVGHWHTSVYFNTRGVHAFACGSWQGGGSSFGKSLGGAPAIGSWIVEYSLTEAGTLREVNPVWRSYFEYEDEHLVRVT